MFHRRKLSMLLGLAVGLGGCEHEYHDPPRQRQPVDALNGYDRGLQSPDLLQCTDRMCDDLLASQPLSGDHAPLTIVAAEVFENQTVSRHRPYNIFIDRLKTELARRAHGRVQLVENLDRYRGIQREEVEVPAGADGKPLPLPAGVQPDFVLYGKVAELPNRETSTYRFEFNLTDLHNRTIVWTNEYLVKVDR